MHFVDNTYLPSPDTAGYDRLGRVWPILDLVGEQCLNLYNPHCESAIDEAMIPCEGRYRIPALVTNPAFMVKRTRHTSNNHVTQVLIYIKY